MAEQAAQTLALAVGVSALVTVACRRMRFPALLPLLAVGLGLGTSGVGLIDGGSMGPALKGVVTVAIGLLIFEGALHLNREELAQAPRAVWGLLTVGALVTWVASAAAAHWILGLTWPLAAVLGATLIVTGPTVVQPILRLVRVSPRLHAALGAEAVLIDPIGVVATVATLEVVRLSMDSGPGLQVAGHGFWAFVKTMGGGAGVGALAGIGGRWLLTFLGRSGRPDPQLLNLLAVGLCMTCVGVAEAIAPEAGLAAVTICGMFVARTRVLGATELRSFKELLATILVGTLFVLLASRFDAASFRALTARDGLFVLAMIFVVRPACVLAATWRSSLTWRERTFASLFAPRGIVALSVAAIVASELAHAPAGGAASPGASRLEPVMFLVIVGTVTFATIASPMLAWALKVRAGRGNAVVLVGAHPLSVAFAQALRTHGIHARLIDRNASRVTQARRDGLDAVAGDATDTRWLDDAGAPHDAGWVLAWTGNDDVDLIAARWGVERFGPGHAFLWSVKPPPGSFRELDMGSGRSLAIALDHFEAGETQVVTQASTQDLDVVLGWIDNGILTLATPGAAPPKGSETRRYIGIRAAGAAGAAAAAEGAEGAG